MLINRVNNYTHKTYKDDPVIMAWQLCNEPRGLNNESAFNRWIDETSCYIKTMDSNHLVSVGTEGETPYRHVGLDFVKNNSFDSVDYMTAHLWVQNWNFYRPEKHTETFSDSINFSFQYIDEHIKKAGKLGKPLVFEEFGFPRDNGSFSPGASTRYRDEFFERIFNRITGEMLRGRAVSGVNFWSWSGTGRPSEPYGSYWRPGNELIGDPPHEPQGWYGIYSGDTTIEIIKKYAQLLNDPSILNHQVNL